MSGTLASGRDASRPSVRPRWFPMPLRRSEPSIGRSLAVALACVLLAGCAPHPAGRAASQPSTQGDWRNATYQVTCDGLVPGKLPAKLVNGSAKVPVDVSQSPYYDDLDV